MVKPTPEKNAHAAEIPTTDLRHLGFRRFQPHPALRLWVQCYWLIRQSQLPPLGYTEKLYPDGGNSLIFNLGEEQAFKPKLNTSKALCRQTFQGSVDCLGIRFNPGGAFRLLGLPAGELSRFRRDLDAFGLSSLTQLQNKLMATPSVSKRLTLVDTWLRRQANKINLKPGIVQLLLPDLLSERHKITGLLQRYGISRRKLERIFQQEVGIAPGHLKTLYKIKRARLLLKSKPDVSLTEVAHECGFYDQAHFIRHFRRITEQTPGAYRRRKLTQLYP